MATFRVKFYQGFNYISIPLDLTGASYEDDPKILFNPSLRTEFINGSFAGEYVFKSIISPDYTLHNNEGEWEGDTNWDSITTSDALIIFCNTPTSNSNTRSKLKSRTSLSFFNVTFNGDEISNPSLLQYDLSQGWNLVSYPYTIDQHFGEGDYTTDTAIDFALNTNYLAGSGHADSCIDKVLQKRGTTPSNVYTLEHDGSGDNSTDWIQGSGANKLEFIKSGYAFWVHATGDKSNATLWDNSTNTDDSNYNHLQGTAGVTTAQTTGNRGLNTFSRVGSHVNPDYEREQFAFEFGTINNSSDVLTFKIKDASGDDILSITGTGQMSTRTVVTGTTAYEMGFFVERLFNADSARPNWGNRGYLESVMMDSQMLVAYWGEDTDIAEYGMEHYSVIPSMGITINDLPMFKAGSNGVGGGVGMQTFDTFHNEGAAYVGIRIALMRDTTIQDMPLLPSAKICTGFRPGDFIVPVIYDPTASDGERYRYCKYYPHKGDYYHGINSSGGNSLFYHNDNPDYYNIFYNEDGDFKFDPVLGDPYIEPVYKKIPYALMEPDILSTKHVQGRLGGIIQML